MHVRVDNDEREQAMALANELGLTLSEAMRVLLGLADKSSEPNHRICIDADSASNLADDARQWGRRYNQIVHKLNKVAYYLSRDMADADDVLEELQVIEQMIDKSNTDIAMLCAEAEHLSSMCAVRR